MKCEHKLERICSWGCDMEEKVVRWCSICGGVVIDIDFDGHTNPGQTMQMKFPLWSKQKISTNKEDACPNK